jgi:RNA ligase (TIGR02306 family)
MYPVNKEMFMCSPPKPTGGLAIKHDQDDKVYFVEEEQDVSDLLGITKFEPKIPTQLAGYCGALYGYTKSYDIDSLQGAMRTFEDGEQVVVTEKLHGTLAQFGFLLDVPEDKQADLWKINDRVFAYATSKGQGKKGLIQKNNVENKDNAYVSMFQANFIDVPRGKGIVEDFMSEEITLLSGVQVVAIYIFGEIFGQGIQKGYAYGKPFKCFSVFDVYLKYHDGTGEYLDDEYLTNFCENTGLTRVPVLYRGPYSYEKMVELRDGKTVEGVCQHIREGIVIRTVKEKEVNGLPDNRAQCKFVSPDYLLKATGEEIG